MYLWQEGGLGCEGKDRGQRHMAPTCAIGGWEGTSPGRLELCPPTSPKGLGSVGFGGTRQL